ncbi:MAG: hypothetical protein KatS3mg092_0364 [Patescibacteria group bacterium]|nr:MAG: hypothetical protein KatS3mg092_0364 [Patescibacteria group bacterium]
MKLFQRLSKILIIFLSLIVLPAMTYFVMESSGTQINTSQQKVIYDLPYPGILPDHPLYFLKIIRDRINEFIIRDLLKKAQLYLNFSDKRAAMALLLAKKGKNQAAITTFSKGEKYFEKIIDLIKEAKKQGNQPPSSFIELVKLSNAKHNELIIEIMKLSPQGLQQDINQLLDLNLKIKKELETLP